LENGLFKLAWKNGQLGNMKALTADVDATYSPAGLEVPTFFIGNDRMDFQAIVSAKGQTLEISKIQLDQGQAKYASGYASIPFIWKNVGTNQPVFPRDGKVNATFDSENLDLKKLFDDFGIEPAATGFLSVKLQAGGTLADLQAHLDVDGRDLRNPKLTTLDRATFRLSADAAGKKLNLAGELKQAKIQPLSIAAEMPFDAGKILSTRSFDENTPVQATVRLPRSSVNFMRQFIPAVEQLDGDVAFDVAIGGTVAHPAFSGSGDITINAARFTDATLPAIHGFQSRLIFRDNIVTLERFRGDLAGGPFTIGGRVVFTKLTDANIDLDLRGESVLIARNDSLTARADANLKVTGPLMSATVKGNVALTNSHFLKDIDLIPIGLPGRPAPEPIENRPDYSIKTPPLRDWKFDLTIKTKDPFSIRGNLANGGAIIDLHLGGTGSHPELKGTVKLQSVEATLPFSRLEVTNGFLYFDPSDSFNPKIDLQGTSVIRDYTVRVYVYGSSLDPQAIFTSEPPLPQEEIISLLATGATRQELTGSGNVLAGRAAMLLVQQLYRKIFKKGQPTQSNSVFDRLQIDLGAVDPRTGREQATARFKVNENWVLVGDIGVGGDFRGQVKYLIRFH
jgi:autotransporter translocation and assembly factor TamB